MALTPVAPTLVDGIKDIPVAGTAVALSATSLVVRWIMLIAHEDNTGDSTVGASTVVHSATTTQRGIMIPKMAADDVPPVILQGPIDLADVYVDTATGGNNVSFLYLTF